MNKILEKIGGLGIVPVVKIENAEDALPLGRALLDGDLPIAEITFRTSAAEESIKSLTRELPELLAGAGTVLTVEQVRKAVSAGAKFIVSPGFNPKVVDYCIENDIPITPGINNPTQIEMALERGIKIVKFFPAEASGGLSLLKSMSAPYSGIKFIPTGGINQNNLSSYLSNNKVHACGGSWMVKPELISSGNFTEITRLTKEAISIILGFEFAHLGINEGTKEKALNSANQLSHLFNFPVKEGTSSILAGPDFEIMKNQYLGKHGHIAISTNDIHRAIAYLKKKDISVLSETAKEKDGKLKAIYIDQEVSGFAIHLLQK
ncbi:MAG TPA: bifunctional 4-hydroxy-2-oxoglutarate aldolase/2-dehydro-3-deoxy-phosphogluconate aldolase [Candidatus Atribacteria bacterium]|nr:bifunctional 4-hydroxy-2-oxoglutarate aldolase/2-dehydro-3-deoxy-phosphogluconate aldolase [Candidatus Atribacteria bacterium]